MNSEWWDGYSDQPHIIRDKKLKREIYKKSLFSIMILLFVNILLFPFVMMAYFLKLFNKNSNSAEDIFCMSVNLENSIPEEREFLQELGVKHLLIRFPMWEMERLEEYKNYIESFSEYEVLINLMQSREHIEDSELLKRDVKKIFSTFDGIKEYQVGTTINRKKWLFYSVDEYLKFFEVVKSVRDESFKDIKLIGSSVIDFEYHFTLRSLFNFYSIYYDRFSALLYVDRRGSPFNTQAGFDLLKKIELLYTMVKLSPKSSDTIYITETNWPITGTAPYAPTSEKECVSLEDYADFMVAYYLTSIATKKISRVYWHQLIARGYGLVDNIEGVTKYPAFEAFKVMVDLLQGKKLQSFAIMTEVKRFEFDGVEVFYHEEGFDENFIQSRDRDIFGNPYKKGRIIYRER